MKWSRPQIILVLIMFGGAVSGYGQQAIPLSVGTSLSGHAMSLPRDLPPGLSVLVAGFTKKSGDSSKEWGRKLNALSGNGRNFSYFQTPILASVPRLIRGMVVDSIKRDIPASEQDFFLPIFDHEREWKNTVSYSAPDDTYILIVNQQGIIRWQTHGPVTAARLDTLERELKQ